jgi:hypothetical protein
MAKRIGLEEILSVGVVTAFLAVVFAFTLFAWTAEPAHAAGVNRGDETTGTMPVRRVGWLDPWATVAIVAPSGAELDLASSHDADESIWGTPPTDTQSFDATWTWHGARITLHVPRLGSEIGDEGYARFCDRFARQVGEAQRRMPPDGYVYFLNVAPVRALRPLNYCSGARAA